jgi:hypothetical protein
MLCRVVAMLILSAPAADATAAGGRCEIVDITWTLGPEFPELRKGGTLGVLDGKIISAAGMRHPWLESPTTWALTPADTKWEPLPDVPEGRVYLEGVAVGDTFYAVAGRFRGATRKDVYRLRRQGGRWTWDRAPSLRQDRGWFAIGTVGTKILVAGGNRFGPGEEAFGPGSTLKTAEWLDTARPDEGWKPLPDIPGATRGWVAGASAGGKFYIFGGSWFEMVDGKRNSRRLREALVFDPQANRWSALPEIPYAVSGMDAVTWKDRYIILLGGAADLSAEQRKQWKPQAGYYCNVVLVFDTKTATYHAMPSPMPYATNDVRAAILGDNVYALGGESIDKATSNTTQWLRIGRIRTRGTAEAAESPVAAAVGLTKQLFVDDYVVSEMRGVTRELGEVRKENGGQPIRFTRAGADGKEAPADAWIYATAYRDGRRFRMWHRLYTKGPSVGPYMGPGTEYGYSESTDGIHFRVKDTLKGIRSSGDYNSVVTIDEHETAPAHRYKIGYDGGAGDQNGAHLAHSADGIHWTPYNDHKPVTYRAADFTNQVIWDDAVGLYRLYTRTDFGAGGGPLAGTVSKQYEVRGVRCMTNPDIKANPTNWTLVRHWYLDREGPEEWRRRQLYTMTDWIYHGVHFALMCIYEYPTDVSEGHETDLVRRHERDVMNFYIATSRDGDSWDLRWVYAGRPMIPRGPDRAWDKDGIIPCNTIVTHQDKHWLYYGGMNERHGSEEKKVFFQRRHAMGLATLRLDGFVCLAAGDPPGTVVTRPFKLDGSNIEINADASRGELLVEVLDEAGRPCAGFAKDDGRPLAKADALRHRPAWKADAALASLTGQVIRLRFHLQNTRLYAFQVVR